MPHFGNMNYEPTTSLICPNLVISVTFNVTHIGYRTDLALGLGFSLFWDRN